MTAPAVVEVEARSYELDPYGHVNNAVFVNWLEHGRLAFLRARGETYMSIPETYGVHVVVVRSDLSYRVPALLGDVLRVTSRIARFGTSSFVFEQTIAYPDGRVAADGSVTMACVGGSGKSEPMPPALRAVLDR